MQAWEEEMNETITTSTTEELHEELKSTEEAIARRPRYSHQFGSARYWDRKAAYREYRDKILVELAARG